LIGTRTGPRNNPVTTQVLSKRSWQTRPWEYALISSLSKMVTHVTHVIEHDVAVQELICQPYHLVGQEAHLVALPDVDRTFLLTHRTVDSGAPLLLSPVLGLHLPKFSCLSEVFLQLEL
jgi:hypothetical protein